MIRFWWPWPHFQGQTKILIETKNLIEKKCDPLDVWGYLTSIAYWHFFTENIYFTYFLFKITKQNKTGSIMTIYTRIQQQETLRNHNRSTALEWSIIVTPRNLQGVTQHHWNTGAKWNDHLNLEWPSNRLEDLDQPQPSKITQKAFMLDPSLSL